MRAHRLLSRHLLARPAAHIARGLATSPNSKIVSVASAVSLVPAGATVLLGSCSRADTPGTLVRALADRGTNNLTVVVGMPAVGLGDGSEMVGIEPLLVTQQVVKVVCGDATLTETDPNEFLNKFNIDGIPWRSDDEKEVMRQQRVSDTAVSLQRMHGGTLDVDIVPAASLKERLRAAAAGVRSFRSLSSKGGHREEEALTGGFAFVRAWQGDAEGNLVYHENDAKEHSASVAAAGRITIAEVDQIVPSGSIALAQTGGGLVQMVVQAERQGALESAVEHMRRDRDRSSSWWRTYRWRVALAAAFIVLAFPPIFLWPDRAQGQSGA